jgi:CheY-like chemotaxis protein
MKTNFVILLVEDDQVDAMTVSRALNDIKATHPLIHKTNGIEALNFLKNNPEQFPGIILLDLNMPKMNGIEFLEHIKSDTELKHIPVVVLTTSNEHRDKVESFNLGVAGYMLKPVGYQEFLTVMYEINTYWSKSELVNN